MNPDLSLSTLAETTLSPSPEKAEQERKSLITTSSPKDIDRKYSLPASLNAHALRVESEHLDLHQGHAFQEEELDHDDPDGLAHIQSAVIGHGNRSKSLATLRSAGGSKIHIARPWLKKKISVPEGALLAGNSNASTTEESSGDEERGLAAIQATIRAHERRRSALQRLEDDRDMFTTGKVSAMKAKFNLRRGMMANNKVAAERSDGITDDDEDVVY